MNEDIIKLNLDQQRREYQARLEAEQEERESGTTGPEPMGTMFFGILLFMCIIADGVDILTGGTIGWLIGLFVDAILLISIGLSKSGRKQFKRILVGVLGDSVPLLAFFPFRSGFLIWAFIKSRSETAQHLERIASLKAKL